GLQMHARRPQGFGIPEVHPNHVFGADTPERHPLPLDEHGFIVRAAHADVPESEVLVAGGRCDVAGHDDLGDSLLFGGRAFSGDRHRGLESPGASRRSVGGYPGEAKAKTMSIGALSSSLTTV